MAGEWREVMLSDVCREVRYGYTASATDKPTGIRFLRVTDIASGALDWKTVPFCEIANDEFERYRLEPGDIVIARMGTIGVSALIREHERAVAASYLIRHRLDETCADPRFVSYVLRSPGYWDFVWSHGSGGAVQPNINAKVLGEFRFGLPPLPEQRAIAHILGTLDDKIELSRRMSETLEAMARALFKSWFVDFDPVRAKMKGRVGARFIAPNLATDRSGRDESRPYMDLFPDRLVESELGEIPEGWGVRAIGDLAEVVGGSTPRTERTEYWVGGTHHWVTPKDLSGLSMPVLLDTERKITDAGLAQISSGLLPEGTVLLSSRAPIGYLAIAEIPVAVNQGFIAMRPRPGTSNLFLLRWAGTAHDEIVSHANGSTFLEISKSTFRAIRVVTPPTTVMDAFDRLARPMYLQVVEHERESRTLARLRDTLLPKLISGKLRVKDAEKFLKERGL